ncbi:alpha/beta hydrolase domain-containing protein [Nocardioides sp. YIM 152315]|uniref:alpha/beta hydrolase domain-containing protein n=1 Tax=Nocardioides sp. YIM 152315 TaxID=3031760 RepID=UPI0023D9A976|nr:alpha/beta hydrolase domain-containing protein [Nocardioides sp. YIM 152315]MDF1605736.1 alpha/beta hydrolase domain-containing protein [Nocardioides sp. YIM 152315]
MTTGERADFTPLTCGNGISLIPSIAGPDLLGRGYVEEEHRAGGTARSTGDHPDAPFATRVAVRRPATSGSGTLVVEWLNVSSGQDATPDWNYLAEEVVRRGHTWAGVSAQYNGVHGGVPAVPTGDLAGRGLTELDPQRYGDLVHPGDAYCLDIYTQVARGLAADLRATCVLAVGESQSAFALTSYLDRVRDHPFDGFLVHSRGGAGMPPGEPGRGVDLGARAEPAVRVRDDVGVPVIVVQTETDLFGYFGWAAARQPDHAWLRVWEVAGTAHADKWQIGEFESFLACPDPVNRGQQVYVVRAALRWLESWVRDGTPAPSAPPLEVVGGRLDLDEHGNARGGVRTPVVDAPAEVLSGFAAPGASPLCELFGRTLPLAHPAYASPEEYLAAYTAATDAAIAAGFVLPDDRDAVLAEARSAALPG